MDERNERRTPGATTIPATPRGRRLPGPRWLWTLGAALLVVALVSAVTQALLARVDARLARLQQAAIATATAPQYAYGLNAVAAVAPDDVWAFGVRDQMNYAFFPGTPTPGPDAPCRACGVALHYDGHAWRRASAQPPASALIAGVAMVSPTEGWATAFWDNGGGLLHYVGGAWRVEYRLTADASNSASLAAVAMASATEGWAVGSRGDPVTGQQTPLLLRYTRGVWAGTPGPALAYQAISIRAVAALPGEAWAVGTGYDQNGEHAIALHYANGKWQESVTGQGSLLGVAAVGPGEAWAVGAETGVGPGMILRYAGGKWAHVTSPTPNILHAIAMRTATEGWIGGDGAATLRYDGHQWTKVGLVIHGFEIDGVAAVSPSEAWAIGGNRTGQNPGDTAPLLHYADGAWAPYPLDLPSLFG